MQSTPRSLRKCRRLDAPWEAPRPAAATAAAPKKHKEGGRAQPRGTGDQRLAPRGALLVGRGAWAAALGLAQGWGAARWKGRRTEGHEVEAPGGDDPNAVAIESLLTAYPAPVSAEAARLGS
ncbi:MAG: hypothetical protein IPI35_34315 [Deltaproteobacteria bacterium]|nr:hypothetical protein [Deltaproteobacteria bacterium]